MQRYLTVSEAARKLGVRPRAISDLFYQRRLADDFAQIIGGRRLIRLEDLEIIRSALIHADQLDTDRKTQDLKPNATPKKVARKGV